MMPDSIRALIRSIRSLLYRPRRAVAVAPSAPPLVLPERGDYKTVWNDAARLDAKEWIFTGATDESFERSGAFDVERLLPHLRSSDRVLNIGCGIGRVERYLAPHVRELWGVDISGEMIRLATERLAAIPNVHFRELGSYEFLDAFDTNSFDMVFSLLVLQHIEREDAFTYLQGAHRILKPGGVVYLQFPNFLSPEYSSTFTVGAQSRHPSPGRVRTYTETEVRHLLQLAEFRVTSLDLAAGQLGNAEIYVTARKPFDGSAVASA